MKIIINAIVAFTVLCSPLYGQVKDSCVFLIDQEERAFEVYDILEIEDVYYCNEAGELELFVWVDSSQISFSPEVSTPDTVVGLIFVTRNPKLFVIYPALRLLCGQNSMFFDGKLKLYRHGYSKQIHINYIQKGYGNGIQVPNKNAFRSFNKAKRRFYRLYNRWNK